MKSGVISVQNGPTPKLIQNDVLYFVQSKWYQRNKHKGSIDFDKGLQNTCLTPNIHTSQKLLVSHMDCVIVIILPVFKLSIIFISKRS